MLLHLREAKLETLTALVRLARASSAAAVTAVAVPDSPPTLAPACGGGRVAADELAMALQSGRGTVWPGG